MLFAILSDIISSLHTCKVQKMSADSTTYFLLSSSYLELSFSDLKTCVSMLHPVFSCAVPQCSLSAAWFTISVSEKGQHDWETSVG